MNNSLLELLEEHKEAILKDGKSLVISLEDGVCSIEKGLEETPFLIKVDWFDMKLPLKINDFLGTK